MKPQYIAHSEISDAHIDTIINVNARFPSHIVKNLLPILKENAPSLILNAGSTGGLEGVPYVSPIYITHPNTDAFCMTAM